MPEIKYYEQGRVPGDFMAVLDTIEHYNQWAIVHDHTGHGNTFKPERANFQCFVAGRLMGSFSSQKEAMDYMKRCVAAGRAL